MKIMSEVAQAKILQKLKQHKLAKKYADKTYLYYINSEGQKGLNFGSDSLNILAGVYEALGDLEKLLEIYKLSLKLNNNFQESIAQMQARLRNKIKMREAS